MHTSLLIIVLFTLTIETYSIDPPVWPNLFSQDFVENYTAAGGVYTIGKHWYDFLNSH
jgi:hypothetical protein